MSKDKDKEKEEESTEYAKVENGKVVMVGLPKVGVLSDGRSVSGYNRLDRKTLEREGWLPLEEDRPDFDAATEYLVGPYYRIKGKRVVAEYEVAVKDQPADHRPGEPLILDDEMIAAIDSARSLEDLKDILIGRRKRKNA